MGKFNYHIIANKRTMGLWNYRELLKGARVVLDWKSDHFDRVMDIFVKFVTLLHMNSCISGKNGPIFNQKPPLESLEQVLLAAKFMGVR